MGRGTDKKRGRTRYSSEASLRTLKSFNSFLSIPCRALLIKHLWLLQLSDEETENDAMTYPFPWTDTRFHVGPCSRLTTALTKWRENTQSNPTEPPLSPQINSFPPPLQMFCPLPPDWSPGPHTAVSREWINYILLKDSWLTFPSHANKTLPGFNLLFFITAFWRQTLYVYEKH